MSNLKRVKVILSSLERQGAHLKATKKGWFIMFPDGSSTTVHKSESDPRAEANTRSRVLGSSGRSTERIDDTELTTLSHVRQDRTNGT